MSTYIFFIAHPKANLGTKLTSPKVHLFIFIPFIQYTKDSLFNQASSFFYLISSITFHFPSKPTILQDYLLSSLFRTQLYSPQPTSHIVPILSDVPEGTQPTSHVLGA